MTDREDLLDSVRDYRNPATPDYERRAIADWWKSQGIANQFAAMLRASQPNPRESAPDE